MTTWDVMKAAIADEFSDLSQADQATRAILRLLLAVLLGGLLGFEREHRGKAAGMRTHMLVALGSALFVLVPQLAGAQEDAMSRVIQGIVAGVGFLCAGTILKGGTDEGKVKGLTTSAGLWLTTAVGVAVGFGHLATAVLGTLLALLTLQVTPHFINLVEKPRE